MRWPQRARPAHAEGGAPVPVTVRADSQTLHVEDGYCATLAVTGYPAEVGMGWLEPLLTFPGRLDVALHIEPIPAEIAAGRLRRQMARLEAGWRSDYARGRLEDLEASTAADDAREMAAALARGEGHLFRAGLYLTVHAPTRDALTGEMSRVRALASSMLLDARPATFRAVQGWATTMPLGVDALKMRRSLDTSALAAGFPFTSPDLVTELGDTTVLYGLAAASSVAAWDRFAQDNHNSVVLARSGSGKSYFAKLELLRLLYAGVQSFVVDPEDEYRRLTHAVGGTHIPLGAPGVHLNPLDLPAGAQASNDALTRRALFCHTFVQTLLSTSLHPAETAALDTAIIDTYAAAGITTDPRTWGRPAPLLRDLAATLAEGDTHATTLAARLAPYVTGTHRALFEQATTTQPDGHLVTISLRDLPDELKTPGMLLVLDAIWRQVTDPTTRRPRLITVDEGWLLMREEAGAKFLFRLAKAARKHWAGLTVITQDAPDLLGSDLGRAVVANAATQVLLRQSPTAIAQITDAFGLTQGEAQYLLSAGRGECLLVAGTQRCAFRALASAAEHDLITTNPAELDDDPVEEP